MGQITNKGRKQTDSSRTNSEKRPPFVRVATLKPGPGELTLFPSPIGRLTDGEFESLLNGPFGTPAAESISASEFAIGGAG